ncbi:MAG: hypothetical protein JW763_06025 [candidate division Zixibacteria bacterium]|nr:hypothetical protein [candidate division Zixibacteria bacterium]
MKKIIVLIIAVVLLASGGFAQSVTLPDTVQSAPGITIETAVDRSEVYIGDLIRYRLTITYDSSISLTPPPIGANLGAFDVKDYEADDLTRLDGGRVKLESRFVLSTFTTGDYIIPPIPIEFFTADSVRKILISEPVPIKVKSLIAEGADTADIREVKGPVSFDAGVPVGYYIIAVTVIALALIGFVLWRRHRRKQAEEPVDTRRPWEIAFEDLARLGQDDLPAAGEFKQYYVRLTEIVRAFFGRVYRFAAMDMTTEEFLGRVIDEDMSEQMYHRAKTFLTHADLVKFAKYVPETERIVSDFNEAREMVDQIRRQVQEREAMTPVTEAVSGEGGAGV